MGVGVKNLRRFIDFHAGNLLPSGASILELGAQELYLKGEEDFLRLFIRYFSDRDPRLKPAAEYDDREIARLANRGFVGELLAACGFEYQSLDLFRGYNTILFDLNIHQPAERLRSRFDLVTNLGTTEHLLNQHLAMETLHNLTKIGGIIYHDLPLSGYYSHGYFSYHPLFFEHLASANSYDIVLQAYSKGPDHKTPKFMAANGFPDRAFIDFGIEFALRKTKSEVFRMPLDSSTSLSVDHTVWAANAPDADNGTAAGVLPPTASYSWPQAITLEDVSGWKLQGELFRRYRRRIARWFGH